MDDIVTPTLTKAEIADAINEQIGLNKRESKDLIDAFFTLIRETVTAGESVKISGFGNFQVRTKAARPGRNPRTGEEIPIAARRVVTFSASQKLRERLARATEQENADISGMDSLESADGMAIMPHDSAAGRSSSSE